MIQESNLAFVASSVMDDVPEGGGAISGTLIPDGAMNAVFPDISDLDREMGRFRMRKVAVAIRTLSTEQFGGAKTVLARLPLDAALGYALFATGDYYDTRAAALDRLQGYLYKSTTWPGYLLENHIAHQRSIAVVQRVGSALPPIGKTLCLTLDEGQPHQREQYVMVTSVDVVERLFSDGTLGTGAEFPRWVVTLGLYEALRHDFPGHTVRYHDTSYSFVGKTRIRDTTVADAARYYGARRLAADAAPGDTTVRVDSIFTQLVPSTQAETPLLNQVFAPELTLTLSAGTRDVDVPQQAHQQAFPVTAENRRLNWTFTLLPIPAPGAVAVSYRSQGNWYVLQDDGSGALLGGAPGHGAGTLSHETGAGAVTLGALPDVGSQVLIVYGSRVHYTVRAGASADGAATFRLALQTAKVPLVAGSLRASWEDAQGATVTVAADALGQMAGGGVTGRVSAVDGTIVLDVPPARIPARDAAIRLEYDWDDPADPDDSALKTVTITTAGTATTVPDSSLRPGGVQLTIRVAQPDNTVGSYTGTDNGVGQIVYRPGQGGQYFMNAGSWGLAADQIIGSVDYASGSVTAVASVQVGRRVYRDNVYGANPWGIDTATAAVVGNSGSGGGGGGGSGYASTITYTRTTVAVTAREEAETVPLAELGLQFDLTATTFDPIVANSVRFEFGGRVYDDRAGTLYTDIDPATGSGLVAGTLDLATGLATLTYYSASTTAPVVTSCLTRYGHWTATRAAFRAAASPLKPESVSIVATTATGQPLTGQSNPAGAIVGAFVRGSVNYEFGTGAVEFGQLIDDAWVPIAVDPSTLRYNAVSYTYLPMPADILGIDPVRLPADGRVPIFRTGDMIQLMHSATTTGTPEAAEGQGGEGGGYTLACGRPRLAWVKVWGADGHTLTAGYTLDRATGTLHFASLDGLALPLTVRHTVADLRQLTDVSIDGTLTLSSRRPLSHAYPADATVVASCLLHGDRRARVSAVWDQRTWNNVWSSGLVGEEAPGTLDTIAHPITVTNEGAETESWALEWLVGGHVRLAGQHRGQVYTGPFTADIAPINPRTRHPDGSGGVPFLTIPVAAYKQDFVAGNVVRIETVGAYVPLWITLSVQQSEAPLDDGADGVELMTLGNIDRP